MTRFQTVEGQMDGWPMSGTIATILGLTISRMLRAGYAPWMYQLSWDSGSKCTTWSISFDSMLSEEMPELLTSSSMVEFVHQYYAGDGVNTVVQTLTVSTLT